MELENVNRFHAQILSDQVGISKNVIGRKNIAILVLWRSRPLQIFGRNLRGCIQTLVRITRDNLAEQTVALTVSIGPRAIEEVAAELNRELQCFERLFVIRTAPTTHAPKPVCDVADFKSSTAKLAIFHAFPLVTSSPRINPDIRGFKSAVLTNPR